MSLEALNLSVSLLNCIITCSIILGCYVINITTLLYILVSKFSLECIDYVEMCLVECQYDML